MTLTVERDVELVTRLPQHFHVTLITYRSVDEHGQFQWSTTFDLVANDVELAKSRALGISKEEHVHVRSVRQCHESEHVG